MTSTSTPMERTQHRWRIRFEQMRHGQEPCFDAGVKNCAARQECPWAKECQKMRADWAR